MKRNHLFISIPIIAFIITFSITILLVSSFYSDFKPTINKNEKLIYDKVQENEYFKYKVLATDEEMYVVITSVKKAHINSTEIIPNEIDGFKVKVFDSNIDSYSKVVFYDSNILLGTSYSITSYNRINRKISRFGDKTKYEFKKMIGKSAKYYNDFPLPNVIYELNYDGLSYGYDYYDDSLIDYIPVNPVRKGYTFTGWYVDSLCTNQFDFVNTKIDKIGSTYNPTLLYAGWEAVNHE